MGEKKGGSVVTENPKGGIAENFGRIQRGEPLKFAWKNEDIWGEGSRKSSEVIRGDLCSEVTFKGRDWLNFTLFSLKSFAPPPFPHPEINNDRSVTELMSSLCH